MSQHEIDKAIQREYTAGFTTNIESDTLAPGLNEDVIRFISAKKSEPEWLLEWRKGLPRLVRDDRARVGPCSLPANSVQ